VGVVGRTGAGKCLGRGTLVLMASGKFKSVESIAGGDVVMGDDGTPRNVTGVTRGRERMVRIVADSGARKFDLVDKTRLCDEREAAKHAGATGFAKMPDMPTLDTAPAFVCNLSHVLSFKLSDVPRFWQARDHTRKLPFTVHVVVASRDSVGVVTHLASREVAVRSSLEASVLCAALGRAVDASVLNQPSVDAAIDGVLQTLSNNVAEKRTQKSTLAAVSKKVKTSSGAAGDEDSGGEDAGADDDDDDDDDGNNNVGAVATALVLADAARARLVGALRARLGLTSAQSVVTHDETIDIAVADFVDPSKTSVRLRRLARLYHAGVMQFPPRGEPTFDPWLLGCWLGDGSGGVDDAGRINSIGVTLADDEVITKCNELAVGAGLKVTQQPTPSKAFVLHLVSDHNGGRGENLWFDFVNDNELGDARKHIPDDYKYGSVETRRKLLAGLLDADGCTDGPSMQLCLKNDTLLADAAAVARSLGFQVTFMAPNYNAGLRLADTYNGKKGEPLGWYCQFTLSGDLTHLPMLIARKRAAARKSSAQIAQRESFKIQLVNEVAGGGWAVLVDDVCAALDQQQRATRRRAWLKPTTASNLIVAALNSNPTELARLQSLRDREAQQSKAISGKKSSMAGLKDAAALAGESATLQVAEAERDQVRAQISERAARALGLTHQQRAARDAYVRLVERRKSLYVKQSALNKKLKAAAKKADDVMRDVVRQELVSNTAQIAEVSAEMRAVERRQRQATLDDIAPAHYTVGDYFGFAVDGNGRFVVGERCFVTHNSSLSVALFRLVELVWRAITNVCA
jgi:hypothetical protein